MYIVKDGTDKNVQTKSNETKAWFMCPHKTVKTGGVVTDKSVLSVC